MRGIWATNWAGDGGSGGKNCEDCRARGPGGHSVLIRNNTSCHEEAVRVTASWQLVSMLDDKSPRGRFLDRIVAALSFSLEPRAAQWWPRCHCRKSRISEPGVHRVSSLSAILMGNRTWSTFNSDQAKHLLYIYIYSSASVVSRCSYTKSVYWKSPPLWPTAV